MRTEIYASLGSNQDREDNIRSAVQSLRATFGTLRLSSVYQNKAVGFDGDDFLNMVVAFDSEETPQEIQQQFRQIEDAHGRIRNGEKFAARLLDIDLILYGDLVCDEPALKLPRIDIVEYAFVLLPLAELEPEGVHPLLKITYAQSGDASRFRFPRPMTDRQGLDFSFSGLKTFAMNTLKGHADEEGIAANIAVAFQQAVVDTLAIKCRRAMDQTGFNTLVVAGGVGANQLLREKLRSEMQKQAVDVFFPHPAFCTDNSAMIAYAGALRLQAGQFDSKDFSGKPRWPMTDLVPVL